VTIKKRTPRKAPAAEAKASAAFASFVHPEQRMALIAEAAYFRAERRGFWGGGAVEDWLAAESEVDAKLMRGAKSGPPV
jgi:hypothetical protein